MTRFPFTALAVAALASLVGSCAGSVATTPVVTVRARSEGFGPASVAPMHRHVHHRADRERVEVACPVALDDPGLVLATVRAARITACDVAIAREQRLRAGMSADDPRAILRSLVDEALLASEAAERAPRLEPAVARALADALVRDEARTVLAERRPTRRELDRWLEEHPESRVREARVHLRQLVFASQDDARRAIAALRAGTAFEELLERSVDPLAERDQGDLGLLTAEGAPGVLPAVVVAGFSLTEPGSVVDHPVAGNLRVSLPRAGGRRRGRARVATLWHVVQLLERVPEERLDDAAVRERAADRILRDRYSRARAEAREGLAERFSPLVHQGIDHAALSRVRVRP